MENLKVFIKDVHETALEHGWWTPKEGEKERTFGEIVSLIHSELSEALEFERDKNNLADKEINYMYHYAGKVKPKFELPAGVKCKVAYKDMPVMSNEPNEICKQPDGLLPELADVLIRIFDYVGYIGREDEFIDALVEKHEFNKTRPYRHGGKAL